MIKHCRLILNYEVNKNMKDVLMDALQKANVSFNDISLHGDKYHKCTHFGNWVLTPVKDNEATKKIADVLGTKLDNHSEWIEAEDINSFRLKDKVSIQFFSDLGLNIKAEGRIFRIEEDAIVVMEKNRKRWGWKFRIGDDVVLRKIKGYTKRYKR